MHFGLLKTTHKSKQQAFQGESIKRRAGPAALLTALLFWVCAVPVLALAPAYRPSQLVISQLDTSAFPTLSFYLELYNADGEAVDDLSAAQVMIQEDMATQTPSSLEPIARGLQLSVAINASPMLAQQVNGVEQFSAIRQTLAGWSEGKTAEFGDFSLAGNTGLQLIRSRDPAAWRAALDAYRPDLAQSQPGLFALTTALDLASEQNQSNLFKSAILFITAPLGNVELAGLANQAERAANLGLPVFVWLVVSDPNNTQLVIPGMDELNALAENSGGKLALVSAATAWPDLDTWIDPLRTIYRVQYASQVKSGGTHTLSAQVNRPGLALSSARQLSFELNIAPPNPMFVNPPAEISRTWSGEGEQQVLGPGALELQVLVEFPDGYQRPLRAARLYVNNTLAAENKAAPFETLTWDLTEHTVSEPITLRVEVEDSIGLKGATIDNVVAVVVAEKPPSGLMAHITTQGLVAIGAVLLSGAVLTAVLVGENRLQARRKSKTQEKSLGRTQPLRKNDPVTQPVKIPQEQGNARGARRASAPTPSWPRGPAPAPARLVRLAENETPLSGSQIPVNRPEITIGSDPRQAVIAVSDTSVGALHARLLHTNDGSFILEDKGSVAGTWVNYTPVTARRLAHGDLIHLGRVMYRFELADAPKAEEISIRPVDQEP